MKLSQNDPTSNSVSIRPLPKWVGVKAHHTIEEAGFFAGAALMHLDQVLLDAELPADLLRDRLAMEASLNCLTVAGRTYGLGDLRDEVHFLRDGDAPGPAGLIAMSWRRAVERPVSVASLKRALPHIETDLIAESMDAGRGTPLDRAVGTLRFALSSLPKDEAAALILADAVLCLSLAWKRLVPLLGVSLTRRDLRGDPDALQIACQKALVSAVRAHSDRAADLARRVERLNSIAVKLRAKGSEEAVALITSRDAVTPAHLASLRSSRSARRFCDRLIELGVIRELSGRDTFRLYGV
ncbi:DUF1403 family protein [Cognatishimia sp. D5M38]|uniref:DUF1403 family protein n=1 Tax=Cognatishimia coralii TaxID=3083254 RepID=A0ABU8QLD6_9RHOB